MDDIIVSLFLDLLEFMGVTSGGMAVAVVIFGFVLYIKKTNKNDIESMKAFIKEEFDDQKEEFDDQNEKIDKLYNLVRKVENDNSAIDDRVKMHADHFDVVDKDVERAKQRAHKALLLCFDMVKHIRD